MSQLLESIAGQIRPTTLVDIGITAFVIYWLFSLIRGTRAVRLVIGVSVILVIYAMAQAFGLRLFTQIMQAGAVVGLFALVVVFQPELRRGLERLGRVGSFAWLVSPAELRVAEQAASVIALVGERLGASRTGALIVVERETGLEEIAETGVMIHGDLTADLLEALFAPRAALHDGAVIIRGATILAAGAILPSAETSVQEERFGTRHRAALGITEGTDAVVVVVSEESGQVSLVERARIRRNLDRTQIERALLALLRPERAPRGSIRERLSGGRQVEPGRLRRAALSDLGRRVRHSATTSDSPAGASGAGGDGNGAQAPGVTQPSGLAAGPEVAARYRDAHATSDRDATEDASDATRERPSASRERPSASGDGEPRSVAGGPAVQAAATQPAAAGGPDARGIARVGR